MKEKLDHMFVCTIEMSVCIYPLAGAHGDPHIKTLDGKSYDFNGLGEFQFMISKTASFESQIRFEQVTDSTGTTSKYVGERSTELVVLK